MSPHVWMKLPMATNWRIWAMTFTNISMTHRCAAERTTDHATPSHVKEKAHGAETRDGHREQPCLVPNLRS
ncbi:hypothetical protein CDEST_13860 [Colletotrichum destructivum]|uniref:Secreted protein n=1 Tax=Colletotrichum destructivum TaxID=34406 RepID=A0AAX4J078_9PEZI|nr:hypothetical protein CDEST_13860 [Colletotrichum destructivum]